MKSDQSRLRKRYMQLIKAELEGKIGVGGLDLEFEANSFEKSGEEQVKMSMQIDVSYGGVTDFSRPRATRRLTK